MEEPEKFMMQFVQQNDINANGKTGNGHLPDMYNQPTSNLANISR